MNKVQQSGHLNFFNINSENMKVKDLISYFSDFIENNMSEQYVSQDDEYHKEKLPNEKKLKVLINDTRISTFFCFSDKKKVLLFDRKNSDLQTVQNDSLDCFGSVTFENISLKLKINNEKGFFNSDIKSIENISGFAYENNTEENDNVTVIMFGFVIYLSTENLEKALSENSPNLKLFDIESNFNQELLTTKARLAYTYLNSKINQ